MPSRTPYQNIPEDILKEAVESGNTPPEPPEKPKKTPKQEKASDSSLKETKQKGLFKKKRAGVVLTKEEVKAIKEGRKKLRKEMKSRGIKSKREFEMVAGSLGLYFDKPRNALLLWLSRHWLGTLIASLLALLAVIFIFAGVTQLRGYYTINLSNAMFREGFTLCDSIGFENPTVELFAEPAENVPCVSIKAIDKNVDEIDGQHNKEYFAYTYYLRNEGEHTVDFTWELQLNSQSKDLADAAWVALYLDGKLGIYAMPNIETGREEALPAFDVTNKGYINIPIQETSPECDQFQIVQQRGQLIYYRVVPYKFETSDIITSGRVESVQPGDVHKFTVVLWLEGDDVDANNSKIGGHLGVQMNFRMSNENVEGQGSGWRVWWDNFWSNLFPRNKTTKIIEDSDVEDKNTTETTN